MLIKMILLFVLVPIGELALLIEIGRHIGVWPTIGIVVVTGVIGSILLKQQGLNTWRRFRSDISRGGFPGNIILEGVLLLIGGAFLLTPGVVTDAFGFILLIPPTRRLVLKAFKAYLRHRFGLDEIDELIYIAPEDEPPETEQPPLDPSKRIY